MHITLLAHQLAGLATHGADIAPVASSAHHGELLARSLTLMGRPATYAPTSAHASRAHRANLLAITPGTMSVSGDPRLLQARAVLDDIYSQGYEAPTRGLDLGGGSARFLAYGDDNGYGRDVSDELDGGDGPVPGHLQEPLTRLVRRAWHRSRSVPQTIVSMGLDHPQFMAHTGTGVAQILGGRLGGKLVDTPPRLDLTQINLGHTSTGHVLLVCPTIEGARDGVRLLRGCGAERVSVLAWLMARRESEAAE